MGNDARREVFQYYRFFIVNELGDIASYDAVGPQHALDQHYNNDPEGEQPFVVGVYRAGNSFVGRVQ